MGRNHPGNPVESNPDRSSAQSSHAIRGEDAFGPQHECQSFTLWGCLGVAQNLRARVTQMLVVVSIYLGAVLGTLF